MIPSGDFDMVAKTYAGFEQVLAQELIDLGAADVRPLGRAVAFRGDRTLLYRAHLWLRTAVRILLPIHVAVASDSERLYMRTREVDWSAYMGPDDTFAIDSSTSSDLHPHSLFAAQRVKDAIADQFMGRLGRRPSVDIARPTLRVNLRIHDADVILALDASGDSLHRRGYRTEANEAPLSEVLAAGMLLLAGWNGDRPFVDWMCGSGTLLIEAAGIAAGHAPGLWRTHFGFEQWRGHDVQLWRKLVQEARAQVRPLRHPILGSDISGESLRIAERNIERAGFTGSITLRHCDFADVRPPAGPGLMVTNPPYGERLTVEEIEGFYAAMGDAMKQHFQGYDVWILSGNASAMKRIGLRANRKMPLMNGAIECRYQKYELFAGRRAQGAE